MNRIKNYEFISQFKNKTLNTVISVVPNYPKTEISNEVLLNFSDGSQLLISSDYADVETPFHKLEDDSVLEISETINYEPFCNIEDFELSSIQVNEPVFSVDLVIDEATLPKDVNSTCRYLVAVFIGTQNHQFNIWKDLMTGFYLHGDFHFGNTDGLYKPEERWDDYDFPIHVRRVKYSYGYKSNSWNRNTNIS